MERCIEQLPFKKRTTAYFKIQHNVDYVVFICAIRPAAGAVLAREAICSAMDSEQLLL